MRFPGHAYVELKNLNKEPGNNTISIWGFYREECRADIERLNNAQKYQAQHPDEQIVFSKAFLIDQDATDRIEIYASRCLLGLNPVEIAEDNSEASYNFFINN